jgi:hypothetical protein
MAIYIPPPNSEDLWRLVIVFLACAISTGLFFMGRKCMCQQRMESFSQPAVMTMAPVAAVESPMLISINANLTGINTNIAQLSKDLHQMLVDQHTQQAKQDAQEAARTQQSSA